MELTNFPQVSAEISKSNAQHHTLDSTLVTPHFHLLHHLTHCIPYTKQNRSSMFNAFTKIISLHKKTVIAYRLIQLLLPWSSPGTTAPQSFPAVYDRNAHQPPFTLFLTNLTALPRALLPTNISFHGLIRRWQHKSTTRFRHHSSVYCLQVALVYNGTDCDLVEIVEPLNAGLFKS
jgi:hypothetical protein